MSRTPLQGYIAHAEHDVQFLAAKVGSELAWLEGSIRDLRREVARGNVFEQRNLVAKAADVAEAAGKLRAAHERLGILKDIASTDPAALSADDLLPQFQADSEGRALVAGTHERKKAQG